MMKRASWKEYQKQIAEDNYYYGRSCIRQNFFPGSEKLFIDMLHNDLGKDLLDDYREKVLERGKISPADTLLISVNLRCIRKITDEGESLYRSVADLVLYATGAAACSTSDLLLILEGINIGLDNIEAHLNRAYFETWRYIQLRIGYWKESIYRRQSKLEIIEGAFGRWREAGLNPGTK